MNTDNSILPIVKKVSATDHGNVIPFLWIHGEPHDVIKREINKIIQCGIDSFCIESRPHPDFCGEHWWRDMDFIISFAREKNLHVWLLDDKCYPSGVAGGVLENYPNLRPRAITAVNIDVLGEMKDAKCILTQNSEEKVEGCYLFPRKNIEINFNEGKNRRVDFGSKKNKEIDFSRGRDITKNVNGNLLTVDIPAGFYRIVALISYTEKNSKFIDMLNPDSTSLMLSSVYEPHFKRYGSEFGTTFAGFFTDEPGFRNIPYNPDYVRQNMYDCTLGIAGMGYPFSDKVAKKVGMDINLVSLWYDTKVKSDVRVRYMNEITDEYRRNFSLKLGEWCAQRGVGFMGHVVEDMGAHTRLGSGAGHFFKSMAGQNYAGIDVVLHQIRPRFNDCAHFYPTPSVTTNPDFFCFTLAKLAASAARCEPIKGGRAVCEIFGAYGWGEDVSDMLFLINFMVVRGINNFVPHAFNAKTNDSDCPPHFGEKGNPQFEAFENLMHYTKDLCQTFSGGDRSADIAVLYHAEAEWSGSKYEPCDFIVRILTENQRDHDIIDEESLHMARVGGGIFSIGDAQYKTLIVPYRQYMGKNLKSDLTWLTSNGVNVIYSKKKFNGGLKELQEKHAPQVRLMSPDRNVRVLMYIKGGKNIFMLFNEGNETACNTLITGNDGCYFQHGGLELSGNMADGIPFVLNSGQASVFFGCEFAPSKSLVKVIEKKLDIFADIYTQRACGSFEFLIKGSTYIDINSIKGYERFCGKVAYEFDIDLYNEFEFSKSYNGFFESDFIKAGNNLSEFNFSKSCSSLSEFNFIKVGNRYGAITAFVNGEKLSSQIGSPYIFDLCGKIKHGKSRIRIELAPTLALGRADSFSVYNALPALRLESVYLKKNICKGQK